MDLSSYSLDMKSGSIDYEVLKQLSGYRQLSKRKPSLQTDSFPIEVLHLSEEGGIVTAPYSFSGHSFATYTGPAAREEASKRIELKEVIQKALSQTGISRNDAEHIVEQVTLNDPFHDITTHDLRQIIALTENLLTAQPREEPSTDEESSITEDRSGSELSSEFEKPLMLESDSEDEFDYSSIFRDVPDSHEWKLTEEVLQQSEKLLRENTFNPKKTFLLLQKIQEQRKEIESLLTEPSREREMIVLLGEQRDHLIIKEKMLSQYLENDPFSDRNVLYPRRVYAEAAKLLFEGNQQPEGLSRQFDQWYRKEVDAYEKAPLMQRSYEPSFYLDKHNRGNPFVIYNANRVVQILKRVNSTVTAEQVEKMAAFVMNQSFDWQTTERHLTFSMGEKRAAYLQLSTPLSKTETAVGLDLRGQGIGGIIPSVRDDGRAPINARLTQLFKIVNSTNQETGVQVEQRILLHERQQHGINDHFAIKDPRRRRQANFSSMKQLVQSGAEADPAFIRDAIAHPEQPHQLFYINTNLTTPTWTPRGNKNDEASYSRHQGEAMVGVEKEKTFLVLNPDQPATLESISLEVTCIDFRFPVNYAISNIHKDIRGLDPGMFLAWPALDVHNTRELRKLFGRLDKYAPIEGLLGSTYRKLCDRALADREIDDEAAKIQREIEEQILYIREIFQTESYKTAGADRFKMPRHLDLLINAFRKASELVENHQVRVINAGGCMSGKDREGVANSENEAAVIIEDLGGTVEPGSGGRYNQETQVIYDTCMTGVVQNTRQVTGIGGSKNAQEIANQMSSEDAKIYAQGGSRLVLA